MGADDDRRAVVDVVEGVDGLDAEVLELAHDAVVVDDLAERVRRLAGGRGLLGLVDRLANAIAEAGALGDADFLDGSHASIIARGPVRPRRGRGSRPLRRRPAGRGGSSSAMRRMMRSVARPLAGSRSVPGGSSSASRNGAPTRTVTRPPGCGSFWPRGQTPFEPADPDRARSGRRSAARARRRRRGASWSAPSALRVPSGKTNRTWPSSRIRWASRKASTSAAPRSTGWTPPLRAIQPTIGQSNSSFLPSQWIRRPSVGVSHAPRTTGSKFEAWLAAMITGPSRGISSIAPSIRIRVMAAGEDPRAEGHRPDERGQSRSSIGSGRPRRRRRPPARSRALDGHRRASASRIAFVDRVDGVLEAVAVGRR